MPISLETRLLAASSHAYLITADGPVGALTAIEKLRATTADYALDPAGYATGLDRIDAALVGEAPDRLVVAFRGTLPPNSPAHIQTLMDWATDADA